MAVFGICFLVFIIASVVFCCVLACKQQPGRRGQVMQNRLGTMTATTTFGKLVTKGGVTPIRKSLNAELR